MEGVKGVKERGPSQIRDNKEPASISMKRRLHGEVLARLSCRQVWKYNEVQSQDKRTHAWLIDPEGADEGPLLTKLVTLFESVS